jgi:ParB family chromosome partitioning protein
MSKDLKPRGLGRGLAALLGDDVPPPTHAGSTVAAAELAPSPTRGTGVTTVPITWLKPGKYQPRTAFDPERLAQLAESIKAHGLVQPILVRPIPDKPDRYEIVAGERRWRAAQQAQLHDVPVVMRPLDDRETLEIALIENLQRTDLSPIEEARAYRRLRDEFKHTQERLAETIGKSRSHVTNTMRLLELPAPVQAHIEDGRLDMGHARALIGTPDPVFLADVIVDNAFTVRRAELLANDAKEAVRHGWDGKGLPPPWKSPDQRGTPTPAASSAGKRGAAHSPAPTAAKTAETRALERSIEEALGLHVSIEVTGPGETTRLTLVMDNYDQLDDVTTRLTRKR